MDSNARDQPGLAEVEAVPKKRQPKFHGFALTEEDKVLLPSLSASFREILAAKGSYREIARVLYLRPGTVRSRLHRARAALVVLRQRSDSGKPTDFVDHHHA
jgi:DNA invertase Pin-like site-specific DNA recombinase